MKRILVLVSLLLVSLSLPLSAAAVEGHLVGVKRSARIMKEEAEAAEAHTKDCALAPDCKSSGYGIVTSDGKFYKFDDDGDRMAADFLVVAVHRDNDISVVVNGSVKGDKITVVAIQLN